MATPHTLSILLVDDENITHQTIGTYLRESGYQLDEARDGAAALKAIQTSHYDVALVSVLIPVMDGLTLLAKARVIRPEMPVVLMIRGERIETVVQAVRLGVTDLLMKPIALPDLVTVLDKVARLRALSQEKSSLRASIGQVPVTEDTQVRSPLLVGVSPAMRRVREQIQQVVEGGCHTILITGETGTGKEVVAREIHAQTGSAASPFIAVSCPAVPDSLVESELFGHVKGAFTGATADRAGYFELAHGGTLFLDEIADFSAAVQATLLRVLETRTLRRVGGTKEITVDLRVITATNAPVYEWVKTGKFRRDLFYRLNGYTIHLLPLRERRDDILLLAEHFLARYSSEHNMHFEGFSLDTQHMLLNYDFPGNVRELRSIVERAALQCRSGQILPDYLDLLDDSTDELSSQPVPSDHDPERTALVRALEAAKWNRRQAARDLGISYPTLRYRLKKFGIG